MYIFFQDIFRASVPASVNGQVFLDRACSSAFAVSDQFLDVVEAFAPGSMRTPTTGHDNLPRSHTMSAFHTYYFPNSVLTTTHRGNLWDPGGSAADPTGFSDYLTAAGNVSEIINPVSYCDMYDALVARGITFPFHHWFFDWWSGYSEGVDFYGVGGVTGTYEWYKPPRPEQLDIDGNLIPVDIAATYTSIDWKKLENRRCLKYLKSRGLVNIVINVGGEDWRGTELPFPWEFPDPGQKNKYAYLATHSHVFVADLKQFIDENGWTDVTISCSFLESLESGKLFPLDAPNIGRDQDHLKDQIRANGTSARWLSSSMHYRGDWSRFLRESSLYYSFPCRAGEIPGILAGKATWTQACNWITWFPGTVQGGPYSLELLPMANSVGDGQTTVVWESGISYAAGVVVEYISGSKDFFICQDTHVSSSDFADDLAAVLWVADPSGQKGGDVILPPWQSGIVGCHQLIDQIKSPLRLAQMFPGFNGDNANTGSNADAGLTGSTSAEGFVTNPMYHAMKTFGPILQKSPDVINVDETNETGVVQLVLGWIENGKRIYSVWLINKAFTGSAPNEIGVSQTVPVLVPDVRIDAVRNVRRFSETELTNDVVAVSPVTVGGPQTLVVDLVAFSVTYFEIELHTASQRNIVALDKKVINIGERAEVNLVVKQGSTFRVDFVCKDTLGTAVDLTEYEAIFRAVFRDTVITKTTADLIDKTTDGDADLGYIHLVLEKDEARLVPLGKQMLWGLELRLGSDEDVILSGYVKGKQGVDNTDG